MYAVVTLDTVFTWLDKRNLDATLLPAPSETTTILS